MTQRSLVGGYQRLEGTYCPQLEDFCPEEEESVLLQNSENGRSSPRNLRSYN
jgi:hypothetical protein